MTEAEWLACADPKPMMTHLARPTTDRKLRLFAVACCRRVWHRIPDPLSRWGVETLEMLVEGLATEADLRLAHAEAEAARRNLSQTGRSAGPYAAEAAASALEWNVGHWPCVGSVATQASHAAAEMAELSGRNRRERKRQWVDGLTREQLAQANLFRCLIGNPFRPVALVPACLTSTVVSLAKGMYESRDFGAMPILADALQDAGCDSADVLGHCRGPGPHVRGCWVVDLVLGKE